MASSSLEPFESCDLVFICGPRLERLGHDEAQDSMPIMRPGDSVSPAEMIRLRV